jgi:hypothetical protein
VVVPELKMAQPEIYIQRDFRALRLEIQALIKLIDKLIKGN